LPLRRTLLRSPFDWCAARGLVAAAADAIEVIEELAEHREVVAGALVSLRIERM
jgi:hypothetical protein